MKDEKDILVVADDRERTSRVPDFLAKIAGVTVDIRRLRLGDYQVDGGLLFERKTLADFAASIVDGRLFKQMVRLANSARRGVLILEGTAVDLASLGVRREAMQGALITTSLLLGIPVLRAQNPGETARLITYSARQVKTVSAAGFHRPGHKPKRRRPQQLYLLQGLPGIGREKAARLLAAFGSVEAIVTASQEELKTIDGIGEKTAQKIRWMVSEQISPYGTQTDWPI